MKKLILIVAGDIETRDGLMLTLSRQNFNLKVASCVEDSLKLMWASPPDAVVIDFDPSIDAATFLKEARELKPNLCVVALVSKTLSKTRHKLKYVLNKPFNGDLLLKTLNSCLKIEAA